MYKFSIYHAAGEAPAATIFCRSQSEGEARAEVVVEALRRNRKRHPHAHALRHSDGRFYNGASWVGKGK